MTRSAVVCAVVALLLGCGSGDDEPSKSSGTGGASSGGASSGGASGGGVSSGGVSSGGVSSGGVSSGGVSSGGGGGILTGPDGGVIPGPDGQSTIVFDTRAGGAESYQSLTTYTQMLARWDAKRFSNGATGFFVADVDGQGTKARGIQWEPPNGTEQEAMVNLESHSNMAPASGFYTQWKMYLGRSPSGGGTGALGQFAFTGGNGHQKTFIWHTGGARLYMVMRPSDTKISIDELNYSSPLWSINPMDRTGEVLTITVHIKKEDGTLRAWIDDTQVLDASGQDLGDPGGKLNTVEETVTTFPAQQQVQYIWDTVIWY